MEQASCCCAPARPEAEGVAPRGAGTGTVAASAPAADTVSIPGGLASTGTRKPVHNNDGEAPVRQMRLQPFRMDRTAVTNRRFAAFVAATGFVTEAERFGWSFVFYDMLPDGFSTRAVVGVEWWRSVEGAAWNHPEGPDTTLEGREDHPVTHVSWNDAAAFAQWAGGRLPSEAEWEHAARGGLREATYPWGDQEPDDAGFMPCNIWQGEFPRFNSGADGHRWVAPAASFAPNGYGLYNMAGNTWEWCSDKWRVRSLKKSAKSLNANAARLDHRLMKGGSFLCHRSYCHRYRIAARHGNTPDTSTSHIGFRLVYPA